MASESERRAGAKPPMQPFSVSPPPPVQSYSSKKPPSRGIQRSNTRVRLQEALRAAEEQLKEAQQAALLSPTKAQEQAAKLEKLLSGVEEEVHTKIVRNSSPEHKTRPGQRSSRASPAARRQLLSPLDNAPRAPELQDVPWLMERASEAPVIPKNAETVSVFLERASVDVAFGFKFGSHFVVSEVKPGSPASGRLIVQDVVIQINGEDVQKIPSINKIMREAATILLTIKRPRVGDRQVQESKDIASKVLVEAQQSGRLHAAMQDLVEAKRVQAAKELQRRKEIACDVFRQAHADGEINSVFGEVFAETIAQEDLRLRLEASEAKAQEARRRIEVLEAELLAATVKAETRQTSTAEDVQDSHSMIVQAMDLLVTSSQDDSLKNALHKAFDSEGTVDGKPHPASALATTARSLLSKASADGRLAGVLSDWQDQPTPKSAAAFTVVAKAKKLLNRAKADGRLAQVLADKSGEIEAPRPPPEAVPKDILDMHSHAVEQRQLHGKLAWSVNQHKLYTEQHLEDAVHRMSGARTRRPRDVDPAHGKSDSLVALKEALGAHSKDIERLSFEASLVKSQALADTEAALVRRHAMRDAIDQLVAHQKSTAVERLQSFQNVLQALEGKMSHSSNEVKQSLGSVASRLASVRGELAKTTSSGEVAVKASVATADSALDEVWRRAAQDMQSVRVATLSAAERLRTESREEEVAKGLSEAGYTLFESVARDLAALVAHRNAIADDISTMRKQLEVEQKVVAQLAAQRQALKENMQHISSALLVVAKDAKGAHSSLSAAADEQRNLHEAAHEILKAPINRAEQLMSEHVEKLHSGLGKGTVPILMKLEEIASVSLQTRNAVNVAEQQAAEASAQASSMVSAWAAEVGDACDSIEQTQKKTASATQELRAATDVVANHLNNVGANARSWGAVCTTAGSTLDAAIATLGDIENARAACTSKWGEDRETILSSVKQWSAGSDIALSELDRIMLQQGDSIQRSSTLHDEIVGERANARNALLDLSAGEEHRSSKLEKLAKLHARHEEDDNCVEADRKMAMEALAEGAAARSADAAAHADHVGECWQKVFQSMEALCQAAEQSEQGSCRLESSSQEIAQRAMQRREADKVEEEAAAARAAQQSHLSPDTVAMLAAATAEAMRPPPEQDQTSPMAVAADGATADGMPTSTADAGTAIAEEVLPEGNEIVSPGDVHPALDRTQTVPDQWASLEAAPTEECAPPPPPPPRSELEFAIDEVNDFAEEDATKMASPPSNPTMDFALASADGSLFATLSPEPENIAQSNESSQEGVVVPDPVTEVAQDSNEKPSPASVNEPVEEDTTNLASPPSNPMMDFALASADGSLLATLSTEPENNAQMEESSKEERAAGEVAEESADKPSPAAVPPKTQNEAIFDALNALAAATADGSLPKFLAQESDRPSSPELPDVVAAFRRASDDGSLQKALRRRSMQRRVVVGDLAQFSADGSLVDRLAERQDASLAPPPVPQEDPRLTSKAITEFDEKSDASDVAPKEAPSPQTPAGLDAVADIAMASVTGSLFDSLTQSQADARPEAEEFAFPEPRPDTSNTIAALAAASANGALEASLVDFAGDSRPVSVDVSASGSRPMSTSTDVLRRDLRSARSAPGLEMVQESVDEHPGGVVANEAEQPNILVIVDDSAKAEQPGVDGRISPASRTTPQANPLFVMALASVDGTLEAAVESAQSDVSGVDAGVSPASQHPPQPSPLSAMAFASADGTLEVALGRDTASHPEVRPDWRLDLSALPHGAWQQMYARFEQPNSTVVTASAPYVAEAPAERAEVSQQSAPPPPAERAPTSELLGAMAASSVDGSLVAAVGEHAAPPPSSEPAPSHDAHIFVPPSNEEQVPASPAAAASQPGDQGETAAEPCESVPLGTPLRGEPAPPPASEAASSPEPHGVGLALGGDITSEAAISSVAPPPALETGPPPDPRPSPTADRTGVAAALTMDESLEAAARAEILQTPESEIAPRIAPGGALGGVRAKSSVDDLLDELPPLPPLEETSAHDPRDRIEMLSEARPEWQFVDLAAMPSAAWEQMYAQFETNKTDPLQQPQTRPEWKWVDLPSLTFETWARIHRRFAEPPQAFGQMVQPEQAGASVEHVPEEQTLTVILERAATDVSLGFKLGKLNTGDAIIKEVIPGGVSDGKLQPYDILTHIDGIDVKTIASMGQMLRESLRIEMTIRRSADPTAMAQQLTQSESEHRKSERRHSHNSEGEPTGGESAKEAVSVAVGDVIVVATAMKSDSKEKLPLSEGTRGIVRKVDDKGDVKIQFDGIEKEQWVKRRHLHTLKKMEADSPAAPSMSSAMGMAEASREDQTADVVEAAPSQTLTVVLEREAADISLGFKLGKLNTGDAIVQEVKSGSVSDGKLKAYDILTHIEGVDMKTIANIGQKIGKALRIEMTVRRFDDTSAIAQKLATGRQSSTEQARDKKEKGHAELVESVFQALDNDKTGFLTAEKLTPFVQHLRANAQSDWSGDFIVMCQEFGIDPSVGVPLDAFARLVVESTADQGIRALDPQLQSFLTLCGVSG